MAVAARGWIIGFYGYSDNLDQPVDYTPPDNALLATPRPAAGVPVIVNPRRCYYSQRGQLTSTALATFGQVTWRFAPQLSLEVGGRYSYDEKRGTENQFQIFYNVQVDPGNAYTVLNRTRNLRSD